MRVVPVLALAAAVLAGCRADRKPSCELQALAIDAAVGDLYAKYDLAVAFYTGKQVPRNYAKAAALWRQVADAGNAKAKNNLGFLTYYGYGVRADPAAAVRLWREAAALGEIEAHYHLGVAAREGKGMEPSRIEAWAHLRAAELMGDTSREAVDRSIAENARDELRGLKPMLLLGEQSEGEARARRYASAAVRRDTTR